MKRSRWLQVPASRDLTIFGSFGLVAVILTWPLASGASISVREDYLSNLWNLWWMHKALFEVGTSPWWTDWLFYPDGISLVRHTLSPVNSLPGALLTPWIGEATAFNVLLLVHFWLSAWTFYCLARYLTGSATAAYLGGLIYSFCPYHYYYVAQINVASMEWLPLAVLFFLRSYREGGWSAPLAAAVCTLLVAASHWYYLVCLALFGVLLLAFGRLWASGVPWLTGCKRACIAGLAAAVLVAPLAWPLLSESSEPAAIGTVVQDGRAYGNDLLGAKWVEPRPHRAVSWPTMFGYSSILLILAGAAGIARRPFWLVVGLFFWVLGLGNPIRIGLVPSAVHSPLFWLYDLPMLEMFRKPDRVLVMVQLVLALLCGFAWMQVRVYLSAWLSNERATLAVWLAIAAVAMVELTPTPLGRFETRCSPWFETLAQRDDVATLVELPVFHAGLFTNAHYNLCQISHGRKIPQGFVTSLAVTKHLEVEGEAWLQAWFQLLAGDPQPLAERVDRIGIDLIVLNKQTPFMRPPEYIPGPVVWRPFRLVRQLARARQLGIVERRPLPPRHLAAALAGLERSFGPPVHEDASIVVFRAGRAASAGQ